MRGERVKVGESRILTKERESDQEHGEKRMDSTVKEGRFRGDEGRQSRRISLGEGEKA